MNRIRLSRYTRIKIIPAIIAGVIFGFITFILATILLSINLK